MVSAPRWRVAGGAVAVAKAVTRVGAVKEAEVAVARAAAEVTAATAGSVGSAEMAGPAEAAEVTGKGCSSPNRALRTGRLTQRKASWCLATCPIQEAAAVWARSRARRCTARTRSSRC